MKFVTALVALILASAAHAQEGHASADIASFTGVPPLPPDAAEQPFPGAVHCTVSGAAGHMVSIYVTPSSCTQWLAAAQKLSANGPTEKEILAFQAQQELAETGGSEIFALFLCESYSNTCKMEGAPRIDSMGNAIQAMTFRTLVECQNYPQKMGLFTPPNHGRFMMPNNPKMWYECRGKHIDNWEPAE